MSDYFGAMGTALYSALTGGSALISALGGTLIYQDQAPDNASLPYVVFSHMGGAPIMATPKDMREGLWYIRAYAQTRAQANRLDGLLDDLVHKVEISVSSWTTYWCAREVDRSLVENPPGDSPVFSSGGIYRIRISK